MPHIQTKAISPFAATAWKRTQFLVMVATVLLLVGLYVRPQGSLSLLWNVLIPILPATFLITPTLWRSLCPLATFNMSTNGLKRARRLPASALPTAGLIGIVLLGILVPARRFLFNENGLVLATFIIILAVAAMALGVVFEAKSGFCNAICPVLPVEKMYGQHPLIDLRNPRCATCTLCTAKGCVDLMPKKAMQQAMGARVRSGAWLHTPYGVFAGAFPGFIVGYFTVTNVTLSEAATIYLTVGVWAAASYAAVWTIVRLFRVRLSYALPILGGMAVTLYYWFAAPGITGTMTTAMWPVWLIRIGATSLAVVWLWRALTRASTMPAHQEQRKAVPLRHVFPPENRAERV